jgi:hypothetical protein
VRRFLLALGGGVLATFVLLALAFLAGAYDMDWLARALFWQNSLLQSLVPLGDIGTPGKPVHEGSPLNLLAFLASIPLGIAIYSSLLWTALAFRGRGNHQSRRTLPT